MKKQDPFMSFDWYFTDVSKRDAARYHALNDKQEKTSILMNLVEADTLVHFALWSELPKNHPVGELWLESQTDLLATIYLAYGGFFRQALAILRCWFEIAVNGVFFSANYIQKTSRYKQWRQGQRIAPANIQNIVRSLASRQDVVVNVDKVTILKKLKTLYSFLSNILMHRDLINTIYKMDEIMYPAISLKALIFGMKKCLKCLMPYASYIGFSTQTR